MGQTTELRREIKRRFVPLAASHSFVLSEQNAPSVWEFRRVQNGTEQYFDIQWEKYGRPRFVVNFVAPGGSGRLQPGESGLTSSWFRQDPIWFARILLRARNRSASKIVDELITLFRELEIFFSTGVVGKHMHLWPDEMLANQRVERTSARSTTAQS